MEQLNGSLQEPLTQAETKFYGSVFQTLDPNNLGTVSGGVSKPLLEASGLPLSTLGMIWNLADPENIGQLNQFRFCVAMRLISHAQQGDSVSLESANKVAPLAKFQSIKVNNTGSGILNNPSSSAPSLSSRVSSVNSSISLNAQSSPVVPVLMPVQAESFGKMFDKTTNTGVLQGDQAKNIFLKARLPIQILERIWAIVDQQERGELTRPQFIVAMHLIQCFMNKSMTILPTTLSDQLWKTAQGIRTDNSHSSLGSPSPVPQPQLSRQSSGGASASNRTNLNTWIMSTQQKDQYGAIFETLDTTKKGTISGGEVANFLMTSKLPNTVLAAIWELANLDQSDDFTKQEFSIAMYLIQKKLAGYELPDETPVELIQSSALTAQQQAIQPPTQAMPVHQSFDSAKASSALQRSASHMDDLLGIFNTAAPMPPANPIATNFAPVPPPAPLSRPQHQPAPPAPAPRNSTLIDQNFAPTLNYGATLVNESSDDDDGPENLDIPKARTAPSIPGRGNKPHFDSSDKIPTVATAFTQQQQQPVRQQSNYDALKSVENSQFTSFSSQPANSMAGFSNVASAGVGAAVGAAAAVGFSAATGIGAARSGTNDITNQLSNTSVEIANYSNQINSLSKQTSAVSAKKEKAQQELNKMLKNKETILGKLNQLKALHEQETQQVLEVQNTMLAAEKEAEELRQELSVAEASYHAEQTKLEKLQTEYDNSQKESQALKEKLGTLNAESIDLKNQIEEFTTKSAQASNMLAVSQQQVVVQESQNDELRLKLEELKNSIFQIESQHHQLLAKKEELEDKSLNLHEQHTDASVALAEKSIAFSETAAAAAAAGIVVDEVENHHSTEGGENVEEVPTASLDDFDEDEFTTSGSVAKSVSTPIQKSQEFQSDASSPTGTNGMSNTIQTETTPTQTMEGSENFERTPQQSQFALPFNIPHSETSSTQNNPSQSVRGDLDVPNSPTSTINDDEFNSSDPPKSNKSSNAPGENNDSFEMVNHSDAIPSNTQIPLKETDDGATDAQSTVVDVKAEGTTLAPVKSIDEEFPPIKEPSITDDSSSGQDFQDAINDDMQPAAIKEEANEREAVATSKNPFSNSDSADLFDDLRLEEAAIEDNSESHTEGYNQSQLPSSGFSFSQPNSAAVAAGGATDGGDDWEQVFAGFGNDPSLQTALVENDNLQSQFTKQTSAPSASEFTSAGFTNSQSNGELTQAQKLAIEELKGMGFQEKESLAALEQCGWNIDDASNFLLDV